MSNYTAPAAPTTSPAGSSPTGAPPVPPGPPYLSRIAQSGGLPSPYLDVPICAVFLSLFVGGAAANMAVFQINRRHGYKFVFSALLFGFCMARIVALSMRIAWAANQHNVSIAIASQVFTAAGVLLLFVTNLVFAQRIIRACHPRFGWKRAVTALFTMLFASILAVLIAVIAATVQSFFTLDFRTRKTDRTVQLVCATYLAVMAALPIPLVLVAAVLPKRTRIDRFGQGHLRTKFALLLFTTVLLGAGAIFRAASAFGPRPLDDPAWWHGKAAYYVFNFAVELVVVYTYALSRFDKRFHVPDGSSAPGHYSCAEFGDSAAAVASAVSDFEKGKGRGSGSRPILRHESGKAKERKRERGRGRYSRVGKGEKEWVLQSRRKGVGECRREGGTAMLSVSAGVASSDRRSLKTVRSRARSLRSAYATSHYGGGAGEDPGREADLEWMARAMRELYGDEEYQRRHSSQT